MSDELPPAILAQIAGFPEFRMGVRRVQVELASGRTFENTLVAGKRVVGIIGDCGTVPFEPSEVVGVRDMSDAYLPRSSEIRLRKVGERRTWPFFGRRSEYEIVIADQGDVIYSGTTMSPSGVLTSKGGVHVKDSFDWI